MKRETEEKSGAVEVSPRCFDTVSVLQSLKEKKRVREKRFHGALW